jgi:hypothetical protein
VSRLHIVARTATLSVLSASFVTIGCHSSSKISAPTLAFSKVPAAEQESPYKTGISERDYKTDMIEGRATLARPGQRIVLYAKTDGRWGVCRQSDQPFTNVGTDGRWKASVHLGTQYAALGQETFSILRTLGRRKQVRCIFAFREARESGVRRR